MKKNIQIRMLKFITLPVKVFIFLFVLLITATIIDVSINYFHPDFNRGFLAGKAELFQGIFPFGLYVHVVAAPLLIVLTSILIFFRLEYKFPTTHRFMGKIVILVGLFLFVPSSFILSAFALGGSSGIILFAALSFMSLTSLILAYKAVIQKDIPRHRRWMLRFYIFLISAIFLRLNKFIFAWYFDYFGIESYLWAAFLSWVPQWILLEIIFWFSRSKPLN